MIGLLAGALTAGVLALIVLPWRAARGAAGATGEVPGPVDARGVTDAIERYLKDAYCPQCGGRRDRATTAVCRHCGTSWGEEGGMS